MAGKKGRKLSASAKAYYSNYKAVGKEGKNREAKIKRHLKNHPNDKQAEGALKLKPVHRAKPTGKKKAVKLVGTQQVAEGVFSYVSDTTFKPGHPVLKMAKTAYPFDNSKKFKQSAKMSEDFKAVYAHYVG